MVLSSLNGRDTGILFGRFQPLSHGQVELIRTIEKEFGIALHIVMNEKEDTAKERNPYSREQRLEMFRLVLPDVGEDRLHFTTVYLDRGGDVGNAVHELSLEFEKFCDPRRTIIFYVNKPEDVKTYLFDGVEHHRLHYTDLFLPPFGGFAKQEIMPQNISSLERVETDSLRTYVGSLHHGIPEKPLGRVVGARDVGFRAIL